MKKKGVKKKSKKNLSFDANKKLIIGLFAFFAFSFLIAFINFNGGITGKTVFDIFTIGESGADTPLLVKYIFFLSLTGIIFWGISSIVQGNDFLKFLFSGGISYVSIAFILPSEIMSIVSAYSALGVTFMVFLPFVVVLLVTSKLVTSNAITVQKVLVQRIIWGAYAVLTAYYLLTTGGILNSIFGIGFSQQAVQGSAPLSWIILAILVVSGFFFIFNDFYVKRVRVLMRKVKRANAQAERDSRSLASEQAEHDKTIKDYLGDYYEKNREKEIKKLREEY
jgi:hypothetical protein